MPRRIADRERGFGLSRSLLQAAAGGRDAGDRVELVAAKRGKMEGGLLPGCCRLCGHCRAGVAGEETGRG